VLRQCNRSGVMNRHAQRHTLALIAPSSVRLTVVLSPRHSKSSVGWLYIVVPAVGCFSIPLATVSTP